MSIKGRIKRMAGSGRTYTAEQLLQRLEPYAVISFDVFDTLLRRTVAAPADVFDRVRAAQPKLPECFREDRVRAEREAMAGALRQGREEITLAEIYDRLPERYQPLRDEILAAELACERAVSRPDPVLARVFHACVAAGKRVLIVSDMYLPASEIDALLRAAGYQGWAALYVSSESGVRKRTGHLFERVQAEQGLDPRQWVHVGDDLRSDVLPARRMGINVLQPANDPRRTRFTRLAAARRSVRPELRRLRKVMDGLSDPAWDDYYRYGFEVLGPLLLGFCRWLHESAVKAGVERLFFLSRDGYLMQQAYRRLWRTAALPNIYLNASRRALHLPQLWIDPSMESILSMAAGAYQWDCGMLCDELGLDPEQGRTAWTNSGFGAEERLTSEQLRKDSRSGRFFDAVRNSVMANSREKFDLFLRYLRQNGFEGRTAIVDIGWKGNMQLCLQRILSKAEVPVELRGYYIGLYDSVEGLRQAEPFIPAAEAPRFCCTGFMEFPFLAQEGSTRSYTSDGDRVAPILYDYEYEGTREREIVLRIQRGALEFIDAVRDGIGAERTDVGLAYENLRLASKHPRRRETALFGDLRFYDGRVKPLAAPRSRACYLRHPSALRSDFVQCDWKCGFLRRLTGLPISPDTLRRLKHRSSST